MIVGIVGAALVVLLIFRNRATRLKKGYEVDQLAMDVVKSVLGAAVILLLMYKLALSGGIPTVLVWVGIVVLFAVTMTVCCGTGNLIWTFLGSALKPVYNRYYRVVNTLLALLLVWCAWKIVR